MEQRRRPRLYRASLLRMSVCPLLILHCVAAALPLTMAQDSQIPAQASSAAGTAAAASVTMASPVSSVPLGTSASAQQPSGEANTTWSPTEGILLGSVISKELLLWGPVTAPPWLAYVSAFLPCDRISEAVFFTNDRMNYSSSAVSFSPKHFIRVELPLLNTVKGVYTELGCLTACIQSKNFTCRSFDYFWKDGGRCGLHNFTGQTDDYYSPFYSTTNDGADHYDLNAVSNCTNDTLYKSHNFATLGWQAFAIGWTELAIYEFDQAIKTGEHSLTSYLGRTLCNSDFGFAVTSGSYKKEILGTAVSSDMTIHLSRQENLYFRALASLLNASNLTAGSDQFARTILDGTGANVGTSTVDQAQYALGLTLRGVALFNVDMALGADTLIQRVKSSDMTAMAYMTRLLDPYSNSAAVLPYFDRAVAAATAFFYAYVKPNGLLCANLARSSINVLEAYSQWTFASQVAITFAGSGYLDALVGRGLLQNATQDGTYFVKDVGLVFTTRAEQVVLFERAHFHQLQAGQFGSASDTFSQYIAPLFSSSNSFERAVAYRAVGTAYYASAGAVYDSYAANLTFSSYAPTDTAKDALSSWSIGYHQLAQYLRNTSGADGPTTTAAYNVLAQLLGQYLNATDSGSTYGMGLNMLLSIALSRERESNGKMQEAVDAGRRASTLQSNIANASFLLPDVPGAKYFRQLFPLGYIYFGELLKRAYDLSALPNTTGLLAECEAVQLSAVSWLPRNNSRSLLILGTFYSNESYQPDLALQYLQTLISAWNSTGTTDLSSFPGFQNAVTIKRKLENPPLPPCSGVFNVGYNCFGFWVLIAIAIAAVIIIGVTILVLRTRRRIRRPVKDSGTDNDFIFKGPQDLLSPDTNTLSSLYRYGNVGSARSLESSNHELADAYNQEPNGYYKPRPASEAGESEIPAAAPPSTEYSNSTFAPTTLERSLPQAKYERVKRRDGPPVITDGVVLSVTSGSASTMERGFNVPKDFE